MSTAHGERCTEKLDFEDLSRLGAIAQADRVDFFERYPRWEHLYRDRTLAVCLCQGAALHYVDGATGVKDFDVWTFYAMHRKAPFPYRRRGTRDFGISKFGKHPKDAAYLGRRVDLFGRAIDRERGGEPVEAIQRYLQWGHTESARRLAMKPVVVIDPEAQRGTIIWPPEVRQ